MADEFVAFEEVEDIELPPAGDEQREVLKKRKDTLEEKAEKLAEQAETYRFDPSAFEIENEIAQHFNALAVTDAQPGYRYCWVNFMSTHGRGVTYKLAKRVGGKAVWEVVRGDMPENKENESADGTRRIGDVLLMRAREELALALDHYEERKRIMQQEAISSNLMEMGDRYARFGVKVHAEEDLDPRLMHSMAVRAGAKRAAGRVTDSWIRQGRMPGAVMKQGG